ncbi:MAG: putative transport protein [uncultured marine phage]|uniref:Putative transport protein n=1 Tax=uncultured marine phage TaxID=707152 RepID=A0A8D9FQY8_9VIRU|nr:MAG: putative transport protein [uncultured marine phage]
MQNKKSKKSDLERKRFAFFNIGLLIVASLVLMAFNYVSPEVEEPTYEYTEYNDIPTFDDEVIYEVVPQKIERRKVIPDNFEDIKVVDKKLKEGDPIIVKDGKIIIDDGTDCIDCDIDLTLIPEDIDSVHLFTDVDPKFPGGDGEMANWIGENVQYPDISLEMGEQGIVYVKFVVRKDGSISDVKIAQSESDGLNNEAMRLVKTMPKWSPGEQAGKPVSVEFTLPIFFKIF